MKSPYIKLTRHTTAQYTQAGYRVHISMPGGESVERIFSDRIHGGKDGAFAAAIGFIGTHSHIWTDA